MAKYQGSGVIADSDYKYLKYIGKTKVGKPVTIELLNALCISNPDWNFQEKNDTTAQVQFEGCYEDDDLADGDKTEPWTIEVDGSIVSGAAEIVLGAGLLYIGTSASDAVYAGLTRGGGQLSVERVIREQNADNDPGKVKGRVVMDESRPKLTVTMLEWVTKINKLYNGIKTVT